MTERDATASDHLPTQAAAMPQDERVAGLSGQPESIHPQALLAQVLDRTNLQRALKQVRQNKGAPGINGMTVDELPDYLRHHWLEIRPQLEAGNYQPQPVKRLDIPKPDGKTRPLGIPTVLDRFIQQAIAQVVSALRLTVNPLKSAVDRPMNRKFLGFTVSRNGAKLKGRRQGHRKAERPRAGMTRRTRGIRIGVLVAELRKILLGWKAYFGITEVLSPLRDIDKWVRRKLRCYIWKQWGPIGLS